MELGLAGRKVLVAGASRGIGFAIAKGFRQENASVAICGRNATTLAEARSALESSPGTGSLYARTCDLAVADDTRTFVADAVDALGGLDVYVHNASGFSAGGDEGWLLTLTTDLMAPVRGIEVAMPALEASDSASIVLIGSTASVQWFPRPGAVPSGYGPAKAAQRVFVNELGQTLGRHGIRANAVSPGSTYWPDGNWDRVRTSSPEVWAGLVRQFPFRRLVTDEEVARVVVFVASPAAMGVNATHIVVDGGQSKAVQ